ncbi:hypothetical protein BDZ88DRAFT_453803 [Geranomyces variabilis]|nr:hypothetical protein BDZ88DRAFT_453803 [Geranomyces variabilis]KAJ3135907.1 hypothetical protein HDU90_003648 [Geranomyces variabilis]
MQALDSLKAALNSSVEEKVEVNQRHLIDKILARYSAEFTVYRELLQNSNDAAATGVQILFQTSVQNRSFWQGGNKRVVTSATFKNNGRPFSSDDWSRLRKIAEGNPSFSSVGLFGVGFYSLFSICEEPFVTSGNESMGFFWKGDMLYTKRGQLPPEAISKWTSFYLTMREPVDLPDTEAFGRFLATSLAFTSTLKRVEVLVDDQPVLIFDKKTTEPRPLTFSKKVYTLSSPSIFTLDSVGIRTVQLDVQVKEDTAKDLSAYQTFMRIASASLNVRASSQLTRDMERSTKKKPPSQTTMQIMWSNWDEYESSSAVRGKLHMFDDLLPAANDQGRIFIGFPTFQTTGSMAQLAAHLIPTVERESIDFVDPSLNVWNQELLSMGGLLARILFDDEMAEINRLYEAMALDPQSTLWLSKKAAHSMNAFHFKPSTPSPLVSRILEVYFSKSSSEALKIFSSVGIRDATKVRLPDAAMTSFIKNVPVVPPSVIESCGDLLKALEKKGLLRKLGIQDVLTELASRPLSEEETIALFTWWMVFTRDHAYTRADVDNILKSTLLILPPTVKGQDNTIQPLAYVKHHVPRHLIPGDLPIPETCLPLSVSNHFKKADLEGSLGFGWTELPISAWADFVTSRPQFLTDTVFVEKVLAVFSRHYGSLPHRTRDHVIGVLRSLRCIPTKRVNQPSLQFPADSYFSKVNLFPDLPFVELQNPKAVSEVFLKALGVREHVFSRLKELDWDYLKLVKYLATCNLKPEELERLRVTPIFPKEQPEGAPPSRERFRAGDLYIPDEKFRSFGLPVMDLKKKNWKSHTPEANLLKDLGIKTLIAVDEFVKLAATASPSHRRSMLAYFVEHYKTTYASLYRPQAVKTPFLPTTADTLALPADCYADPEAAIMGFTVLHPEWRSEKDKFGVSDHPSASVLVDRLLRSPPSVAAAPAVFGYLAARLSGFSRQDWAALSQREFVPVTVTGKTGQAQKWVSPRAVYFGPGSSLYTNHFTYVDFGAAGNSFLRACGTVAEPSPLDLARSLVDTSSTYLDSLGPEKYLDLLRTIAANRATLKSDSALVSRMKTQPWLIGVKTTSGAQTGGGEEGQDQSGASSGQLSSHTVRLARAADIFLVDDITVNQLFHPLGCPADELLEHFYNELGSTWLTAAVHTEERVRGSPSLTDASNKMQQLIRSRALLLLYDGQAIRSGNDMAKNAEKLLQELTVLQVPEIQIVRTFQKRSQTEQTTACLKYDSKRKGYLLYVVKQVDYFDVGRAIGQIILRNCRLKDSLLLSTLLSTSVENLQRKGFPVDRILKLSDSKLKHAQIVKDQEQKKARKDEEVKQNPDPLRGSNETLDGAVQSPRPPPPPKDIHSDSVEQLRAMFPDADRAYVQGQIQSGKSPAEVANEMLEGNYPKTPFVSPPPPLPAKDRDSGVGNVTDGGGGISDSLFGGWFGKAKDQIARTVEFAQQAIGPTTPTAGPSTRDPTPASVANLHRHLENSISTLRATREPSFLATIPPEPPRAPPAPPTPLLSSQCVAPAANDLFLAAHISGTPLYADRALGAAGVMELLQAHRADLEAFVALLRVLAGVFGAAPETVHVFWDRDGGVIAFNRSNMLFFNIRFYITMHAAARRGTGASPRRQQQHQQQQRIPGAWSRESEPLLQEDAHTGSSNTVESFDAYVYWFLTFCHELAHNFVREHDASHEYWMSSFAERYTGTMVRVIRGLGAEP